MGVQDEKFATAHSAIPIASPNTAPTLRERAEAVALHWSITAPSNLSVEEVRRALHELQVHQIELEMQVQCLSDANDQLEITKNQLNLANARYVDLYDTAPVGYCTLDEQGVIAQANLTTCTILGVTREALVKRPITQFICKDDQDTFYLMRRELEKTRQSQSCELRLLKADGTPLWVHLAINAAEAEYTEDVIRLVISDITKRKLAQVANHTAQSRILGLVDAAMDAIISVDAKMQVVLFNQAAAKIFGVSVDEAMGGTLDRFIPARFRPMHGAQMQAFQGQGKATRNMGVPRHIVGLHSNGQEFPLEASISHLVIGGQILYTVILRDISERTRAEQALRQSDSLNASVLDSLSAHIAVLDERGVIVAVNHAWEQFGRDNGGSASTIIAVGKNYLSACSQDDALQGIKAVLAQKQTTFELEYPCHSPLEKRWFRMTVTALQNSARGVVVSHLDITESHLAIFERGQQEKQLVQMVATRTAELEMARSAAEAANLAKSNFLSTMSHELRTPLNAVVGLTGMLTDSALDRRQQDYANKIQLAAKALRQLIDDVLDFSKIEAGEIQLEHAELSLNSILHTTAVLMSGSLGRKSIEILFDVGADVPDTLVGDALRLQQVLLNLASNAVKFTESGVIVVSVRCISQAEEQVTLIFSVRDSGMGIPSDQLGVIFDRFTQADTSIGRMFGGSGLGLAICERLAKAMKGAITVQSELGSGSEFQFTVPLTLGVQRQAAQPEGQPTGLRVLIVDDHDQARNVLSRMCIGFGWTVTVTSSGPAGLAELERSEREPFEYDLMLLDWRMPDMDGVEMLRQAHATPGVGLPLVVLMAGIFETEAAVAACADLELDAMVSKPITPNGLLEAVRQAYTGEYVRPFHTRKQIVRKLAGMRLLVAEDNAFNQEMIEHVTSQAGAECVLVSNGALAVAAIRSPGARYDAVLMDIQMPVMDGYSATRIIREQLGRVDLPIFALTAHARNEDVERSRLAGMTGHLVKPIDVDKLLDLLDQTRQGAVQRYPGRTPHRSRNSDIRINATWFRCDLRHARLRWQPDEIQADTGKIHRAAE